MFGIAKDIRSEVRVCTPELLKEALDSVPVAQTCAEIEDALEKCRRGEITQEEYEIKITAVNTLKETIVKYHNKVKKVAPLKK
jgi:hypothetical protein